MVWETLIPSMRNFITILVPLHKHKLYLAYLKIFIDTIYIDRMEYIFYPNNTVNVNTAANYYQYEFKTPRGEKVEAEILVNNECGIIIKLSDEHPVDVETYTEATVILYKDKNGKIAVLDIEYDPSAPTC